MLTWRAYDRVGVQCRSQTESTAIELTVTDGVAGSLARGSILNARGHDVFQMLGHGAHPVLGSAQRDALVKWQQVLQHLNSMCKGKVGGKLDQQVLKLRADSLRQCCRQRAPGWTVYLCSRRCTRI
jgi:hypothetical protein